MPLMSDADFEFQMARCERGLHRNDAPVFTNYGTELVVGAVGCSFCGHNSNEDEQCVVCADPAPRTVGSAACCWSPLCRDFIENDGTRSRIVVMTTDESDAAASAEYEAL